MKVELSTIGTQNQVVVPLALRKKLGLHPGDIIEWHPGAIKKHPVPVAEKPLRPCKIKRLKNGRPVLDLPPDAPRPTMEELRQAIAEWP